MRFANDERLYFVFRFVLIKSTFNCFDCETLVDSLSDFSWIKKYAFS